MGLLDFLKHHAPSHQEVFDAQTGPTSCISKCVQVMGALHTVEGLSQDTVAGAAAFEAAKIFENHVAQHGHECVPHFLHNFPPLLFS